VTAPGPVQTPPNPIAAEPGDGRVLSRPCSRVQNRAAVPGSVALRSQRGLTGSGSHRSSHGGFGEDSRTPPAYRLSATAALSCGGAAPRRRFYPSWSYCRARSRRGRPRRGAGSVLASKIPQGPKRNSVGPKSWPAGAPAGWRLGEQLHRSSIPWRLGGMHRSPARYFPRQRGPPVRAFCDLTKHPLHDAHIRPHGR
jgi:hypothetical protein